MGVGLRLAGAGIRHRPLPWLLLSLGVALAVAFPVLAAGLRQESGVAAVTSTLDALPADERTLLANTYRDLRGEEAARLDRTVRTGLTEAGVTSVARALVFKPISVDSTIVSLAALDRVESRVRLTSGRLPGPCRPTSCEVLAVRLPGVETAFDGAARARRDLGVVVTGTAELTDQRLVGVGLVGANRPVLLSGAPDQLADLAALQLFGRTLSWFGTLDGGAIARAGVEEYGRTLRGLSEEVNLAGEGPLSLFWPEEAVAAAEARAAASADRFAVLGAGAGVLQLGLCLVIAAWLRRRQQLVGTLVLRRGGSAAQLTAATLGQAVPAVLLGVVAGTLAAGLVVAVRAALVGADPLTVAGSAVASVAPVLLAVALLAVLLVTAVVRWPASGAGAARYVAVCVMVVAALVPFLVLTGGSGGRSPPSGLLPGVAVVASVVVVGLATALGWPRAISAGAPRGARRRPPSPTPLSSVRTVARRRPLLPMVTAGFLAASCCLLVFTAGYRESLRQSADDQAAYRVPLDVAVAPSARVAAPLEAFDGNRLRDVAPGTEIRPVTSSSVTVFAGTPRALVLPLTGIDPEVLTGMHEFSATTGTSLPPEELAGRLTADQPAGASAPTIPADARRITLEAVGFDADITLGLWVSTIDGRQQQLRFQGRGPTLTAERPATLAGEALVVQGLEIAESEFRLTRREHANEGGRFLQVTTGRLRLSQPEVDGRTTDWNWSGWGSGQAEVSGPPTAADVTYRIDDARVLITPGFVASGTRPPLAVAVDPETAARAGDSGRIVVDINKQAVPAQIVAVLPRFPTGSQHYLVADRATVVSLLNQIAPGSAFVSRVWIAVPDGSLRAVRDALRASPASATTLSFRADLARAIVDDPVASRSILLLLLAGAVALALALVASATGVRADVEESRGDARALEIDGVPPAGLRSRLLRRGVLVAAVSVPIGLVGGVLLTVLGVQLLLTGPGGTEVVPPLRPVLAGLPVLIVVLTAAVGVLAASVLAATAVFREDWPLTSNLDLP